jgi:hypothetical protein
MTEPCRHGQRIVLEFRNMDVPSLSDRYPADTIMDRSVLFLATETFGEADFRRVVTFKMTPLRGKGLSA